MTSAGNRVGQQNTPGLPGSVSAGALFGHALAAGDFDGDGFDDLAIGAPGEDVSGHDHAGAVFVLRGSASGLLEGAAHKGDWFGHALAAGDFDGDGEHDLAIGAPGADLPSPGGGEGLVSVLRGSASTYLLETGDQVWHQRW